jgi:hypothetical protein
LNNLLAASHGNNANNGERIIQMTEGTSVMLPPMDQGYVLRLEEDYYSGNMA